jgi:hypothetical protein
VLGVNEEHTRRALGDPLFGSLSLSGHGVLTWRLPFGYVSAVFAAHALQSWAITLTDFGVRLPIEDFAAPVLAGVLGESTFEEAAGDFDFLAGQCFQRTNRRVAYCEATPAGGATGGLAYMLAWNDAGAGDFLDVTGVPGDTFDVATGSFSDGQQSGDPDDLAHLRSHSRPNLIAVARAASDFDCGCGGAHFVDMDVLGQFRAPVAGNSFIRRLRRSSSQRLLLAAMCSLAAVLALMFLTR